MADWGPVIVGTVLFILLQPGLLFQMPASGNQCIAFATFKSSKVSAVVHTILYFAFICIFLLAIGIHAYFGS
ncbi:unnamed protein product [Cuscuta campestris]|uniref:Uncharacterized protein n=1 Tax=Cuscuta campestris TaxID=132261 RepID=A0A484NUC7_9ASTE|nr:unnamed protein product [Cuscuta campestris]